MANVRTPSNQVHTPKPCPVNRADFHENAQPVQLIVNGVPMLADVKEFSTGSLGWYLSGKSTIRVGDVTVPVQLGVSLTVIGSKDLPR